MTGEVRADLIERPGQAAGRDDDFVAWLYAQAALLRRGDLAGLDREGVAEELEDMAKRERRELNSRFKVLLQHLLKWEFQPDRRARSWLVTMDEQRDEIAQLVEDSPSLRNEIPRAVGHSYAKAVRAASYETGMPIDAFPAECPYAPDDALSYDFRPGEPWAAGSPPAPSPPPARRRRR